MKTLGYYVEQLGKIGFEYKVDDYSVNFRYKNRDLWLTANCTLYIKDPKKDWSMDIINDVALILGLEYITTNQLDYICAQNFDDLRELTYTRANRVYKVGDIEDITTMLYMIGIEIGKY